MKPFKAVTLLVILAVFGFLTLGSRMMKPHPTVVLGQDLTLSYPVANTIPSFPWLYIFFFVPFILFSILYALVYKRSWTTAKVIYFMLLAFCINESVTNVMKNLTGRPRPCFFEMCEFENADINGGRKFGEFGKPVDVTRCYETVAPHPLLHSPRSAEWIPCAATPLVIHPIR
ncbi:hypothetical protein WA538_001749 [Blastocystis sp. DL]